MSGIATFSNPVLVAEGVAFCVSLPGRPKAVAVATTALLRPAPGQCPLDAFRGATGEVHEAARRLLLEGARAPVFIEPQHLHHALPVPRPHPSALSV